jgi:hypothetical protein
MSDEFVARNFLAIVTVVDKPTDLPDGLLGRRPV